MKKSEYRFSVPAAAHGMRLDQFLVSQLVPGELPSRGRIQAAIAEGGVQVDGAGVSKTGFKVKGGQEIRLVLPLEKIAEGLIPEPTSLAILYEDDELIVINKAQGVCMHAGAGNPHGTLVEKVLGHGIVLSSIGLPLRPGVVHRLDKGTSGVVVMAKTDRAHIALTRQFARKAVQKCYLAVAIGRFRVLSGTIHNRLGRHPLHRQIFASVAHGGKEAVSHFRVLGSRGPASLIEVSIETGRTHQIRVHLSESGHPIVGDAVYGAPRRRLLTMVWEPEQRAVVESLAAGPLLHAYRVTLRHPITGQTMSFQADLPEYFLPFTCPESLERL